MESIARILQIEFGLDLKEAYGLARKLRIGEMVDFDFADYGEMVACAERMKIAGIERIGMSANPEFDKAKVLNDFADLLEKADDYSFRFDSEQGYYEAHYLGKHVTWFWENEFIAQFVFAEMVSRGAKIVSE